MRLSLPLIVLLLCALASPTLAQRRYGFGTPGSTGVVPDIDCTEAWLGRTGWSMSVSGATPSRSAYFFLSAAQASQSVGGVPVWLDTTALLPLSGIGGSVVTSSTGDASFSAVVPPDPALLGAKVYGQALIWDFDPATGLIAVTRGVEIELVSPPLIAISTSVAGSADPFYLADPIGMTLTYTGGNAFTDAIFGEMASADAGQSLYMTSAIAGTVNRLDLSGTTPTFSVLTSFAPQWSANGTTFGTAIDEGNDLLWTLAETQALTTRELHAIDIAPGSPNYGSVVASTNSIPQPPPGAPVFFDRHSIWDLSHDRTRAAVLESPDGDGMHIIDTDPSSPTFTQVLVSTTVPLTLPGSPLEGDFGIHYAPDDDIIYVLSSAPPALQPGPVTLHRYDVAAGAWIDHNPSTPGVAEGIGPFSTPPVVFGDGAFGLSVAPRGEAAFVSGIWTGAVTRIDFDAQGGFTTTTAAYSPPQIWNIEVNDDGTILAGVSFGAGPAALILWDARTLVFLGAIGLPISTNIYGLNWL